MKEDKFREKRISMVDLQIRAKGVRDSKVLKVMEKVPRHCFIPENTQAYAYADEPLPIGKGQTISQPYI
ncbi:protein-L-isoaspartate O-methyltransferase, partial [bacterium]|nr:protein-L-isoaspartate O-methyltransferase [bacterium]